MGFCFAFVEVVAIGRTQSESIYLFELLDFLQRAGGERGFAFEGVKDNAFEEIAKGHVLHFRYGFEDFEEPLFEAHAGLHALDCDGLGFVLVLHGTKVPRYTSRREVRAGKCCCAENSELNENGKGTAVVAIPL